MSEWVQLRLKSAVLERWELPNIDYPVLSDRVAEVLAMDHELPWSELLYGLQLASAQKSNTQKSSTQKSSAQIASEREPSEATSYEWQGLEPAMARLAELMVPEKSRAVVTAAGDDWWLEIGPVDLSSEIVTIQRQDYLIAALAPRTDGALRVATFRPLDGKSAGYLTALGQVPHPEGGVCFRENNWEYALDCSAGTGNLYASIEGAAHLSYWESGLGIQSEGTESPVWRSQLGLTRRPGNQVAVEIGTHYVYAARD
jgi:hypothetical protein